jgi:glycosyltransferase involved in cell wall biosynthesis
MRVLTFTSLFPNSAQQNHGIFVYQRLAHLVKRPGNDVEVIAPIPYFPGFIKASRWQDFARVPLYEELGSLRVHHPRYPLLPKLMPLHGLLMFLGSYRLAMRLHREKPFDCVDAHYLYPDAFAAALLARRMQVPLIVSGRGTDVHSFPRFRTIRPMIRWTLAKSTGRIAVSQALKEQMQCISTGEVAVIGNGVDPSRFHALPRDEARRKLGLPAHGNNIVMVGKLTRNKGQHLLIHAVQPMVQKNSEFRVYLVGEGPERSALIQLITSLQLQRNVELVGARPNSELADWYSAADVSVLLSENEGWPNVILESLACGTPVVATPVWGIPDIITSPELGILVKRDIETIRRGLTQALQTRWDRDQLVRYASQRTWDTVAEELEQFLRGVVGTRSANAASRA